MSWATEKLGNLFATSGYNRGGSNDFPVLSITMHEGLVDQSAKFKKRIASRDTANYRVVYTNEMVVGFPIDEGVLGFQTKYPAAIVSPAYGIWKLTRPQETYIPYLEGYLRSGVARQMYASKMRGGVARRRTMSKEEFLEIEIPFPPLNEQKRIAAVLDKADSLRHQRKESLQLTEKLLQSLFIDMFGDPTANPKGWQLKELATLGTLDRGISKHRPRNAPALLGGSYPLIQTGDVSKAGLYIRGFKQTYSELGFKQSKLWPKGTLCITIAANIAQTGILDFDACFPDSVVGFTPFENSAKSIYIHFLFGFLQAMLEKNAPQAAQKNINLAILRTLQVPAPPFALQEEFERVVLKIMVLNENQKDSLALAEDAFSSIQQRAFRGELDLSKIVIPAAADVEEEDPMPLSPMEKLFPGRYEKQGSFNAPPDIEAQLVALESEFNEGRIDYFPWSSEFFKYRTLSKVLKAPFTFEQIWYEAAHDMCDATYEIVKDQVLEFLEQGVLEQRFDVGRKEIVFYPRS